ncbi:MAG: hypothetical protein R2991_02640 [Thermoanaerobaculia bacterium]
MDGDQAACLQDGGGGDGLFGGEGVGDVDVGVAAGVAEAVDGEEDGVEGAVGGTDLPPVAVPEIVAAVEEAPAGDTPQET